ncbi:MAG: 4-hydroxy-tetrahydrodipicolinate synthase [Halobacteria archaeon]|nr:4-hydroxy-tetrahydrodipicolinate synthase [Halobacteria archaeon]
MEITEGVFPAIVTPFDSDGEVDYDTLIENVERLEDGGVDGIVPCGSTGESATLTHEEHKDVVEAVVENATTPVIAGTGSNSTHEALDLTKHADETGADGALLISPYYNKPNPSGLRKHYERIADEVDIPLVLYNVPSRTGQNMPVDVVVQLAEHPNIAAIKEASGDINQIGEICRRTRDMEFDVVSGDDAITLPLISVGGTGVISVVGNIFPEGMNEIVQAALDGDYEKAREVHQELLPVMDAMFLETNPIPVKKSMEIMGYCDSRLRLPLDDMSDENLEKLRRVLQSYQAETER